TEHQRNQRTAYICSLVPLVLCVKLSFSFAWIARRRVDRDQNAPVTPKRGPCIRSIWSSNPPARNHSVKTATRGETWNWRPAPYAGPRSERDARCTVVDPTVASLRVSLREWMLHQK